MTIRTNTEEWTTQTKWLKSHTNHKRIISIRQEKSQEVFYNRTNKNKSSINLSKNKNKQISGEKH